MNFAFTTSAPLHLQGSLTAGRVCTLDAANVQFTVKKTRASLRMIGDAPDVDSAGGSSAVEAPDASLSPGTDTIPQADELVGDGSVSVVDLSDDMDEYDFDESEIIPCEPPQPVINAQKIAEAREKFKIHPTDSGSPEFQIATLTTRIAYLTEHLKKNRKDHSSTRGLIRMVSTRRKLLKYVKLQDPKRFDYLVTELKIRVSQNLRNV